MSSAIKRGPKNIGHSLFHHGLVRILVERELSKKNRSWDEFLESNGFLAFCHCQFDCPEECVRNQEPCRAPAPYVNEPVSNHDGRVSPIIRNDSVPAPACSPSTPAPSKRMRESLNLSPVTPKRNDNSCKQKGKR